MGDMPSGSGTKDVGDFPAFRAGEAAHVFNDPEYRDMQLAMM